MTKPIVSNPDDILNVVESMRYDIESTHGAFQEAANILRNRVTELERELTAHQHAIAVMDAYRIALWHAIPEKDETP